MKKISAKYEKFGINLGVPLSDIRVFKQQVTGMDGLVDYCLNSVIEAWLTGDQANVSREHLAAAVEDVGGYSNVVIAIRQQGRSIYFSFFALSLTIHVQSITSIYVLVIV